MLYNELQRVNDIDTTIADLHKHLSDLYRERAGLLEVDADASKKLPTSHQKLAIKLPEASADDTLNTYYRLQSIWEQIGINFPGLKSVKTKLEKALALRLQLEQEMPHLYGSLSIVAVPTSRSLRKLMITQKDLASRLTISNEILDQSRKTTSWQFIVVAPPESGVAIYDLTKFISGEEYVCHGYDGRAVGVYELIAAELQGVPLTCNQSWSVLLKDQFENEGRVCATLDNGQVIFELEDTNCLLGENYLRLGFKHA